jgi:hypothetical protein
MDGTLEYIREKRTDYEPYGLKSKRVFFIFTINTLTYEGGGLSIILPSKDQEAKRIVDLLNAAFQEGYEYRAMSHRCDVNWRGQKLLTAA